jgi:hypothetical protein
VNFHRIRRRRPDFDGRNVGDDATQMRRQKLAGVHFSAAQREITREIGWLTCSVAHHDKKGRRLRASCPHVPAESRRPPGSELHDRDDDLNGEKCRTETGGQKMPDRPHDVGGRYHVADLLLDVRGSGAYDPRVSVGNPESPSAIRRFPMRRSSSCTLAVCSLLTVLGFSSVAEAQLIISEFRVPRGASSRTGR